MKDSQAFDHRPDPELGAALRAALEPKDDHQVFAARVMAQYERALVAGFLIGRAVLTPAPASIDAAMAPLEGPGLAALVTAQDPPDASVVYASLVDQR